MNKIIIKIPVSFMISKLNFLREDNAKVHDCDNLGEETCNKNV